MIRKNRNNLYPILFIFLWTIVNSIFLAQFPFFHSDEIWLASLTETMLGEGTPAVSEPFFDILPRTIHALRIIFHGLQGLVIGLGGLTPAGIRGLSLLTGAVNLFLFHRLLGKSGFSSRVSFAGMILLSLDIQYIYASHFGRQEIVVLFFIIAGLNTFFSEYRRYKIFLTGLLTGLALGIHPNAFIAAWPVSILFLISVIRREVSRKDALLFLAAAMVPVVFFLLLSLIMNGNFIGEYLDFGVGVGVRSGFPDRIRDFLPFFLKLYHRVSGTYYTPDIRWQLIILSPLTLIAFFYSIIKERISDSPWSVGAAGVFGIGAGIFLLGKYSQPSIVFFFPFLYILLIWVISMVTGGQRSGSLILILVVCLQTMNTVPDIYEEIVREGDSFREYNTTLSDYIPMNSRVLGNLNGGLAFSPHNFLDWRNLEYLESEGLSFTEYIISREIEYIVVSSELDYIYNTRPVWNILYGNLYPWYAEYENYILESCRLEAEFSSPGYGMRITPLRFEGDWKIMIYKVLSPSIEE